MAGLIAMSGYSLGAALLVLVPHLLGAPSWVLVPCYVAGAVLGYLTSRTILRWLYTPR
ncbi:hypothetical protein [Nocardioides daeguensis]|uniref:Uncharacterized protein n=1 Tax=Nocardioides daeguensis TaxID=908359 RepID=A0ABP6W7X4_9ACTN|nr:hypothetical protein [Nocardioides daeguensis]MBV6727833.1 hypothetical protein [Nocardioides daeguensis]MCR1775304.1 hypothetical protein [Nocardioides daeguensis]